MFLFCLVFAMFCARLFICALWSPAGKGLASWLSFVVSSVSLSLSHWYPGSGVVLDCIDSWSLHHYLLLINWLDHNMSDLGWKGKGQPWPLKLIYSHCLIIFNISSKNNHFGFNSIEIKFPFKRTVCPVFLMNYCPIIPRKPSKVQ